MSTGFIIGHSIFALLSILFIAAVGTSQDVEWGGENLDKVVKQKTSRSWAVSVYAAVQFLIISIVTLNNTFHWF